MAEYTGISNGNLCRCFKKETGMTITEYLANLRCTEASRLLKESAYPIQEIAAYVGYLDNNYFVKVLKKKYGLTPSEYRNQAR